MIKKFQRTRENFVCEKCGHEIDGDGYTNHCLNCLWSKHVDVNPGDRAADCEGLMEPAGLEMKAGEYVILHKCIRCGHKKKNKKASGDNFDVVLKITNNFFGA